MTFVASLCLLLLFVLWVWCVSALILVFLTCFSGKNIAIVLMKLWWFCKNVLRGKLWEVRKRGSLGDQIRSLLACHFLKDFFVTYYSWRNLVPVPDPASGTKTAPPPNPIEYPPAGFKTDIRNVTQIGPPDEFNFWSPGRAQSTIFSKENAHFLKKSCFLDTSKSKIKLSGGTKKWTQKGARVQARL